MRRSRPEVGFPSVEVTLPWLVSAVAGVNTEGVAVLLARNEMGDDRGAPPLLLVQECLQRFASIDGCLDWCLKRKTHGRALLFIAHADGDVAAVEFDGSERRVIRPSDGLLSEGVSPAAVAELRKARERQPDRALDAAAERATLGAGGETTRVRLEPGSRRLVVQRDHVAGQGDGSSDGGNELSDLRMELVAT